MLIAWYHKTFLLFWCAPLQHPYPQTYRKSLAKRSLLPAAVITRALDSISVWVRFFCVPLCSTFTSASRTANQLARGVFKKTMAVVKFVLLHETWCVRLAPSTWLSVSRKSKNMRRPWWRCSAESASIDLSFAFAAFAGSCCRRLVNGSLCVGVKLCDAGISFKFSQ